MRARLQSLLLLVNDVQAASKFYTHGLGIPLIHKVNELAAPASASIDSAVSHADRR